MAYLHDEGIIPLLKALKNREDVDLNILHHKNEAIGHAMSIATEKYDIELIRKLVNMMDHSADNFIEQISYGLVSAANFGKIKMMKYFISKGADIHYQRGWALKNAIGYSLDKYQEIDTDVIRLLIEKGADVFHDDGKLFKWALIDKNIDFFNYLYSKRHPQQRGEYYQKLIHDILIKRRKLEYIKNFVEKYPDDANLNYLLKGAVLNRSPITLIKYLTKTGAPLFTHEADFLGPLPFNEEYIINNSAISLAIQTKQDKVVRFFTEKVIMPNRYSIEKFFRLNIESVLDYIASVAETSFPEMALYFDDPMLHAFTRQHRRNVGFRQLEDVDPFLAQTMGIIQDFLPDEPAPGQFY